MKRFLPIIPFGILFFFLAGYCPEAKVYIDINSPSSMKFPIAVLKFEKISKGEGSEKLSEKIDKVLTNDLSISGRFNVLDSNIMGGSYDRETVNFGDWFKTGAIALIKGGFYAKGDNLLLEARLFDVALSKMICGKRYIGKKEDLQKIVHKFANEVIYQLTGEQGIFNTKISFVSDSPGNKEIYTMNFDGSDIKQITSNRSINLSPIWSLDGREIVYTSYLKGNPDLYIKKLKEGNNIVLSNSPGLNTTPTFSPDGKLIVLTLSIDGDPEIYSMNKSDHKIKRLTYNWGNDTSPFFSPNQKKIAFVSNRGGTPQIYIMDIDGENVQRLTFEGNYNASPSWSPIGDKIAFTSMHGGYFDIFVINPDGTGLKRLTFDSGDNESPSWSPDGQLLAFSSNRTGRFNIYMMETNGGNQRPLIFMDGNHTEPSWSSRLE